MPMVWRRGLSCKMKGEVSSGRAGEGGRGPGKCATDYYEKSSLKNYETNIYIHHTVYNTKSFLQQDHKRIPELGF